uniref:ATP synthase complex subunit 8 n=1 Tax=Paroster microsturtensis TaxID=610279 RepID=A0A343WA11_9DYTI|nr:ATP synthase F0 subunit 8 [Paroster microsturtensis]AVZ66476.1 ATP synthase F0 subunit 8 [Paroster microsturtensis]
MPQMAPMNWLFLYLFFSMMFILFNFMNFYIFLIKENNSMIKSMSMKFMNWKW